MPRPTADPLDMLLDNGLRIVAASMPGRATVSAHLRWPLGTVGDPADAQGVAVILHEWLQRGAGDLDAHAYADAFDRLGARRGGGVGREQATLGVACLARDAAHALPLLASAVAAPRLEDGEFEGARQLALQELAAAADSPGERLLEAAMAARYVGEHGRGAYGVRAHLRRLDAAGVRAAAPSRLAPEGAVLALAGGADAEALLEAAAGAFAGWRGHAAPVPTPRPRPRTRVHRGGHGGQTHVALLESAVPPRAAGWTEQALAMTALAGATAGRLWTVVREERGLAYDVGSAVHVIDGDAFRLTHAVTAPERASEAIAVLLQELERSRGGLAAGELRRAQLLLRSSVVFESETSGGRAARLASDVVRFGHPRSVARIEAAIDGVTLAGVNAFLASRPAVDPTVVTTGPSPTGAWSA
ncbi:MAG: insulinase family protein [Trueperaceae bacterium]|nr:insulinase family protein [Trueperaceae bacterium]